MDSKVFYKDREVLKINEKYVEGYGWITEEEYQSIMYNPDNPQTQLWEKIRAYNIQYKDTNGKVGQMDITHDDFWKNRTFITNWQEVAK